MPLVDVDVPYSDAWWLRRLSRQFVERPARPASGAVGDCRRADFARRDWLDMLWNRLLGDAPVPRINERYADATREFMRLARVNYAAMVVGGVQDRVSLLGARSAAPTGDDADGDETVRAFMDANGSFFADALTYAFTMGSGAVMLDLPSGGSPTAVATAEDPRQVAWVTDPRNPNRVVAAVKLYRDDLLGADVAHLLLSPTPGAVKGEPDSLYRVQVGYRNGRPWSGARFAGNEWEWDAARSGPLPESVQDFGLPFVPLVNRFGMGEFEGCIDLLDRIYNDIIDRLWTQKFQAFMQRAVSGKLPRKDEKGNLIDYDSIFSSDPAALWIMPEGAEMWEGKQADLNAMLAAAKADLLELSAVTSTPMFMFTPDATGQSAEGADVAREGSVNKARDRISRLDPAAVRVARLALAYSNRADVARGEIASIWAPTREYSLAQRATAAAAGANSGVPWRSRMADLWQFPPKDVARMERERAQDLLYADTGATGGN